MPTPRNQINSVRLVNLVSLINVSPVIHLDQAFEATLPDATQTSFNPGVLCFGRNAYTICRDFLPSNTHLYYKSNSSDTLYETPLDVFDQHLNQKVYCCVLSRGVPPGQNVYILEYYFDTNFGTSGRMLSIKELWLDNQNVAFSTEITSGSTGIPGTVIVNPNAISPEPPIGLFFNNGNYDSVATTLADYYEYRCNYNNCFVLNNPTQDWVPYLSANNVVNKRALLDYWNNLRSQSDPNALVSAMIKHDRSRSRSVRRVVHWNSVVSRHSLNQLNHSTTSTLSALD